MIAVAIIINGISRKKKKFYRSILPPLAATFSVSVFETSFPNHAVELARAAVEQKFEVILAAGGDGTLHQILNGILMDPAVGIFPLVGVIPLGTGNDFARTCQLTSNPEKLISLIKNRKGVPTDMGKLISTDSSGNKKTIFFINCCSLGMGPEVVRRLSKSSRSLGAGLTYLQSIVATFFLQRLPIVTCSNDLRWTGKIRVLAVANGKCFGNGVFIAPDASIDDGSLNIFIAENFSVPRFLFLLILLKVKVRSKDPGIRYSVCKSVSLESTEICPIETEGEPAGFLPATIDVMPARILFLR